MRALFILFLFLPNLSFAQSVKIVDGDTIHINQIKYRFHGIDAPEMRQICIDENNKNIFAVKNMGTAKAYVFRVYDHSATAYTPSDPYR